MERFVVVTGLSGAGKATALGALEELGYLTVDNLPPQLWTGLLALASERGVTRAAVVVDARTRGFLDGLAEGLSAVGPARPEVVYLEASDDVLLRRYGLTRRSHPMSETTLMGNFREERRVLAPLREAAELVIDTSELSARELVERVRTGFGGNTRAGLRLFSFGFKHGAPRDADLVLDVRSMPNPYYDPALSPLSGLDPKVSEHVFGGSENGFYHGLRGFLESCLSGAAEAGRSAYTVAVGCTGGRHRSVAVVEFLARDLASRWPVSVEHRDLENGEGGP